MDNKNKQLISIFFDLVKKLNDKGIIRSSKYSGDIGEYIAKELYNLELNKSSREEGYDAYDKTGMKYEIKFHNGSNGNNIVMTKYKEGIKFNILIVILGLGSKIKPNKYKDIPYVIYIIDDYEEFKGKNIAKRFLGKYNPNKLLDENLNELDNGENNCE